MIISGGLMPIDRQNKEGQGLSVGVVIATKGRSHCVPSVVACLEGQTVSPAIVVFSVTEQDDLPEDMDRLCANSSLDIVTLVGPAGSACQRNAGKKRVEGLVDIVVFIDDDFLLASNWLEECAGVFANDPDIVGLNGEVVADGVITGSLSWDHAAQILREAFGKDEKEKQTQTPIRDTYGCNMAFRMGMIGDVAFDERMVLYAWMEDTDFSRRAGKKGKLVKSTRLKGVHLGISGGRTSGVRYGYSQVANPFYLWKKGSLSFSEMAVSVFKPLAMNVLKSLRPEAHIDRRGRLKGNALALQDIITLRDKPERVLEL
jgi:GT2 family glycosyltransferase